MKKTINDIGFDEFRKAVGIFFNRDFTEEESGGLSVELQFAIAVTAKELCWDECDDEGCERIIKEMWEYYRKKSKADDKTDSTFEGHPSEGL